MSRCSIPTVLSGGEAGQIDACRPSGLEPSATYAAVALAAFQTLWEGIDSDCGGAFEHHKFHNLGV